MDLSESLLWLCRISSPIGEEAALCDAVLARLTSLPDVSTVRRHGDSLVCPLRRGSGGPHVLLAGHLDVVRTEHDGPARIEGDRLYGAGAADMKSGLALMLDLAEDPVKDRVDLTLVFYAREEGPYEENELGRVLDEEPELSRVAMAVALEPSDNKLQLGCGGSVHARVRFQGRTAHSARPWQGDNAIHKAAGLLKRLAERPAKTDRIDELSWIDVISATLAEGGRGRNVIPDRFELNLNHRFGPSTSLDQSEAELRGLVGEDAEVEIVDRSPPAPPRREHPWVRALAESGARAVEPKQAWTDVARFAARGVVAVNFGPGVQAQAHQKNEWTSVAQLDEGRAILRAWLSRVGSHP